MKKKDNQPSQEKKTETYKLRNLRAKGEYSPQTRDKILSSEGSGRTRKTSISTTKGRESASSHKSSNSRQSYLDQHREKKLSEIRLTKQELQVVEKEVVRLINKKRSGLFGFSFTRKPLQVVNSICKLTKNKNNHDIKNQTRNHHLAEARKRIPKSKYGKSKENLSIVCINHKDKISEKLLKSKAKAIFKQWDNSTEGHKEAMVEKDKKFCGVNTQLAWYEADGQRYCGLYTTVIFTQERGPSKSKENDTKFVDKHNERELYNNRSIAIS